ncbi:hypothetical protein CLU79DRAFT_844511 [Phycomyces nitens]|nr:hypothetical protein CLU79DRAFT_844511 [Phycomyces nitens]
METSTPRPVNQNTTSPLEPKPIHSPIGTNYNTLSPESAPTFETTQVSALSQKSPTNKKMDSSDKRKWDASFTPEEQKEASSNILKAQNTAEYVHESPAGIFDINQDIQARSSSSEEPNYDSDKNQHVKRKVQNRAAQKAFRERKENYVNELKQKLKEVQDNHVLGATQIFHENENLRLIISRLESENHALKRIYSSENMPPQPIYGPKPEAPRFVGNAQSTPRYTTSLTPLLPAIPANVASKSVYSHQKLITACQSNLGFSTFAPIQFPLKNPLPALPAPVNQHTSNTFSWRNKGPQYVFDISTPDMIRERQPNRESSAHRSSTVPDEPPPKPSENSLKKPLHPSNNPNALPTNHSISQLEDGLSDCHIHMECQSFCDTLQEQVFRDVLDKIFSEPIFDTETGALNHTLTSQATSNMTPIPHTFALGENGILDQSFGNTNCHQNRRLLSCSEIWQRMHDHPRFKEFTIDQLCAAVKEKVQWTEQGPVLDELEMDYILQK